MNTTTQTYRNYTITRNPDYARDYKWSYTHEDYDGPEDPRRGDCRTEEECREEIDELEDGPCKLCHVELGHAIGCPNGIAS